MNIPAILSRSISRYLRDMRVLPLFATLAFLTTQSPLVGQIGGRYVHEFLRNAPSARLAGLGGTNVSLRDMDGFQSIANPALLYEKNHQFLGFSGASFLAGTGYGTATYARHYAALGTFQVGLQYQGAGQIDRYDALGNPQGTFGANDFNLQFNYARAFGQKFSAGAALKLVYSNIAEFSALALALDFGGLFYLEEQDLGVGVVVKNLGGQLVPYTPGGDREPLPVEVQVGVTKRVPKTPLRFSLTLHNLQTPRLAFTDDTQEQQFDLAGNPINDDPSIADQIFRHTIFGVEFLIGKNQNVQARMAYNHQRRAELKPTGQGAGISGLSFGLGIRITKLYLDYAFAQYYGNGGVHTFGVSTFVDYWGKAARPPVPPVAE